MFDRIKSGKTFVFTILISLICMSGSAQMEDYNPEWILRFGYPIRSVSVSPDGTKVALGYDDNTVHIWDTFTDQEIRVISGHSSVINSVRYSPDGSKILTASSDTTARLWNAATGQLIKTYIGHSDAINSAVFSPDGTKILTGSADASIKLWNVATGQVEKTFDGFTIGNRGVTRAIFSPDGSKMVVLLYEDSLASLWNIETGERIRDFMEPLSQLLSIAFSPDGNQLMTGGWEIVRLWNTNTGQEIHAMSKHTAWVTDAAFSPDGLKLVTSGYDKAIVWDTNSGQDLLEFTRHNDSLTSVAFFPNGQNVITSSQDFTARRWNWQTGEEMAVYGFPNSVKSVAYSPNQTQIAAGRSDGSVVISSMAAAQELHTYDIHTGSILSLAYSPDGTKVVSGGYEDNTAKLFDVNSGQVIYTWSDGLGSVESVAISPDGQKVVTGDGNGTISLWDTTTGQKLIQFSGHNSRINAVAFSPDGTTVASASWDTTAKLWDASAGQLLQTYIGHTLWLSSVAFSPDGNRIMTGSYDGTATIWNKATAAEIITFYNSTYAPAIKTVTFSPDGTYILTGGHDSTAKMWNASTGELLRIFYNPHHVHTVAFTVDGNAVLTFNNYGIERFSLLAPTPTPTSTATTTPTPTNTRRPTPTRRPTSTPSPTLGPTATHTPNLDAPRIISLPQDLTADLGETIEIPVRINNAEGVMGYRAVITFATEQLTFLSGSVSSADTLTSGFTPPVVGNEPSNRLVISAAGLQSLLPGSGILIKFQMTVSPSVLRGSTIPITINPELSRLNDGFIPMTSQDGMISIRLLPTPTPSPTPYQWGELSEDQIVGTNDASLILQYDALLIESFPVAPHIRFPEFPPAGDVSGDGILGTNDSSLILRYDALIIQNFPADTNLDGYGPEENTQAKRSILDKSRKLHNVSITFGNALQALAGETVGVEINIDNAEGISGFRLVILYDSEKMSYVPNSVTKIGTLTESFTNPTVNSVVGGRLVVSISGLTPLEAVGGTLLRFELKIADSALPGEGKLRFDTTLSRVNDGQIPATFTDGSIWIGPETAVYLWERW